MAAGDTEVRIILDAQGNPSIVKVNKSLEKQNKEIGKNTKKKKQGETQSKRNNAVEKSLYQTTLNSSKGFSKQARAMGGSSGLVAAYATLAANVFAATAAFGALQRAAQFEQLKKGLTELGHQSGRTLSVMAAGLREVTGGAISAEEAMRAAALGVSGGFGGEQLEGLAKIAKGASITLGRSLPDAFDRLTRGAIKLEPEILDELGIMVRLDDAVEEYGAQIGKAGSALTQMERRQAFMNAILEQGESKFGEIAEAIEPDVYSRLGATFSDLTNSIFSFVNNDILLGFGGLSDIVRVLADNTVMLFGVMMLFGSTIVGKIIPALGSAAAAAGSLAENQAEVAIATATAFEAQRKQAQLQLGDAMGVMTGPKTHLMPAVYREEMAGLDELTDKKKAYARMQKSMDAKIRYQKGQISKATGKQMLIEKDHMLLLEVKSAQLKTAIALENRKGAAALAAANATSLATAELALANTVQEVANGTMSRGAGWTAVKVAAKAYSAELELNTILTLNNAAAQTLSAKALRWLKVAWFKLIGALQLTKIVLLELFAPIALIIIAVGALVAIWNALFNTKELKAYKNGMEELDTIIDDLPKKVEKYNQALGNGKNLADGQVRAFEIQSGLLTELNQKMQANVKLREKADKAGKGGRRNTGFRDALGAQDFSASVVQANAGFGQSSANKEILDDINVSPKFFKNMKNAGDTLGSLYRIHEGPEYKAAAAIISNGIPDQVEFMNKKIKTIMAKSWRSPKDLAKAFEQAVRSADAAFGALGPAATGLRSAFKEADKEASKFLTSFAKKTSVDAFVVSTTGAVKALDDMREAAGDAGKGVKQTIGTALLDIGGKTGSMLGTDFMDAQAELRKAGKEMDAAGFKIGDGSTYANTVRDAAIALAGFEGAYRDLNKDLIKTQRLELSRKVTLEGINKMAQFSKKHYKDIAQLAGKENKLLQKKLRFEQEITKSKFKQVKAVFTGVKETVKDPIWQNKTREKVLSFEEFMSKTEEERAKLIAENSLNTDQYNQLLGGQLEISLQGLEVERVAAKATDEAQKQRIEGLQKIADAEKKIRDIKMESAQVDAKLDNFRKTGSTSLNAKQEAQFKVDAAKEAAQYAIDNAEREKNLIDIKGRMQMIDIQILNKQLELYNKEEKDATKHLEKINEDDAQKDINKMTQLQRDAVDANIDLLLKKVPLAAMEGVQSIAKAIESGDLFAGIGMGGITDMFKEMKDGKIAIEDSADAATFFKEAMSGNTLPGDKKIHEAILGLPAMLSGSGLGVSHNIDASPMGQNTDDFLSNMDLSIDVGDLDERILKNFTDRVVPILMKHQGGADDPLSYEYQQDTTIPTEAGDAIGDRVVGILSQRLTAGGNFSSGDIATTGVTLTQADVDAAAAIFAAAVVKTGPVGVKVSDTLNEETDTSDFKTDDEEAAAKRAERLKITREQVTLLSGAMAGLNVHLADFGPEGEAMIAFREGMMGITNSVLAFAEASGPDKMQERLAATAGIINSMAQMMAADSKAAVARIDMLIDAEKKKDGKSAESLSKIKGMEGKKLAVQKKAFETNKKMKIASTAISTASGAMAAYSGTLESIPPPWGVPVAIAMAAMVGLMGLKQISMIKKQQFTGGGGIESGAPASITVGKRNNKVDTAKKASSGELAYLRGERGIGTTSTNFQAQNGAAGLRKGYPNGGVVVGERGPEVIQPTTGFNVVPNDALGGKTVNAHFEIHAIDAAGVEDVLMEQQGHIINMIRSAANENGEEFLESIDTQTYGNPQSAGGIDY